MSGEEQLLEEQWRRIGVLRLLRGRRSEMTTLSTTSSPQRSEVYPGGVMEIKVPQNERISENGKNVHLSKKGKWGSITINKRGDGI